MSTRNFLIMVGGILLILFILLGFAIRAEFDTADTASEDANTLTVAESPLYEIDESAGSVFEYDSGVNISYPEEGVKGIFVTAYSAGGERMSELVNLVNETDLNSMVIDVKEDIGDIMMPLDINNEIALENMHNYVDPAELMTTLEENEIYPIARIVVFKDTKLATARPDLSYLNSDGTVWQNGSGESFVNPFLKEVWDYNVEIAIEAAKLGFKEIQFDYVRFPESFETMSSSLSYDFGEYEADGADEVEQRVSAVTDFVDYANKKLKPYNVDVSVDVFGYAATQEVAPGIGQNFAQISDNVDVISSMIYPSHWGAGAFGYDAPDTEPYGVVDAYMKEENELLSQLDNPPQTRPWLQDFTASYLGAGNYLEYDVAEIEAQIQALKDNGVNEYLLWNSKNSYTKGVNY